MSNPLIYPGATVCEGVTFGAGCVVGTHAYVGKGCQLGEQVRIQHGAFLVNRMVIGDRVFIGPNVTTSDDKWPRVNNLNYHAEPPILEDDCNIGAGAVLLPGVRIGHHATVGAGAVVTHDVEPYTVVVGCPARELEVAHDYQPTPEELAGESWAACYGGSDQFPLRPMEGEREHPQ